MRNLSIQSRIYLIAVYLTGALLLSINFLDFAFVDSAIFLSIAFWGILPASSLGITIFSQWLFKVVYETLVTPLTYLVVNFLKRTEQQDHYDRDTNFNPLVIG